VCPTNETPGPGGKEKQYNGHGGMGAWGHGGMGAWGHGGMGCWEGEG